MPSQATASIPRTSARLVPRRKRTGLANAFLTAGNLVSLAKGTAFATTPAGNGTVPQIKINTLADIIATCVNTKVNTSAACTTLFNATPNAAGVKPTTTFDAVLNLAQNPTITSTNTGLINQPSAVSPFQPYLFRQSERLDPERPIHRSELQQSRCP